MTTTYCDRCGNDVIVPNPIQVSIGRAAGFSTHDDADLDLCEKCNDALRRFLGIGSAGYEMLDSEIGGDEK